MPGLVAKALAQSIVVRVLGVIIGAVTIATSLQSPAGTVAEPWIDTSNREAVLVAYAAEYANDTPEMEWTGEYSGCTPGSSSSLLRQATIRRFNFYRAMAGVPTGVVEDEEFSRKAHHAALAMSAEGRLSHAPEGFACLSGDGREAAANSNLYLGRTGPASIDGYIEDPGPSNVDVGHRNTILHPPTRRIGVGNVAGDANRYPSNALWVFDEHVFADPPPIRESEGFVAWPPRGYIPEPLVYPRWSFSLLGADFDEAVVSMTEVSGDGGPEAEELPIPLKVVTRHSLQGYVPAPIIVWEPEIDLSGNDEVQFDITVDGVRADGETHRFDYRVSVVPEQTPDSMLARGQPAVLAYRAVRAIAGQVGELTDR